MSEPRTLLEEALSELEGLDPVKRAPNRYHARALLVPLGELLRAGQDVGAEVGRVRAASARLGESFEQAVTSEVSLACAEHVHAVDPRYLGLPNYDFEYTVRARARLEARLLAAATLRVEIPETLLTGVRLADERLAPYLQDRPRDRTS